MTFELDNVELYFGKKRILNGIYLKAETGKVTGILGSNGCGKSCLLNIAFGILKPKYKHIRIDNTPILKPLYLSRFVSYLPQHNFVPKTYKLKTVFWLFNLDWNEFMRYFESFSLYKNTRFNKLSGGERRILELYIVLKKPSKIVLLDEPYSHLAPLHIEKAKQLIEEEKQHKAIIITDHMYRHIISTSDNIYLLKNGCTKLISNMGELEDYKYLNVGTLV